MSGNGDKLRRSASDAIGRGIGRLRELQLETGEFPTLIASDEAMKSGARYDSICFTTGLVSSALSKVRHEEAYPLALKGGQFLLEQREAGGLWRFWTRSSRERRMTPPDLDDTACSSIALTELGLPYPDNTDLILDNRTVDGLFRTWFIPRSWSLTDPLMRYWLHRFQRHPLWTRTDAMQEDVDSVPNAQALALLGTRPETRPVIDYLQTIVAKGREEGSDKWYHEKWTLYHAISRSANHRSPLLEPLARMIRERILDAIDDDGGIRNPLMTALALLALIQFGFRDDVPDRSIERLLSERNDRGTWDAYPFYWSGPSRDRCWGSEALTTVYCIALFDGMKGGTR